MREDEPFWSLFRTIRVAWPSSASFQHSSAHVALQSASMGRYGSVPVGFSGKVVTQPRRARKACKVMGISNPERVCRTCGRQLGPYETFCGNCGTYYTEWLEHTGKTATENPPPEVPTPPAYGEAAAPPASDLSATQPVSTQYGFANQAPAALPSDSPSPYGAMLPPPLEAVPPPQLVQPARKRPPIGLMALILVLLLALIGGGLFFFLHSRSSPTSVTRKAGAARTVLVPARPALTPLFSDDFANNSKGWGITTGPGYSSTIANHALIMTDRNHRILVAPLPIQQTFTDFQITVDMTLQSGDNNDSMGVYMRGDDQLNNDYRVDIFGDGSYAISKEVTGLDGTTRVDILSGIALNSAIKPLGQQNEITVIIKGTHIVLAVNGRLVASVTDSSYASGMIALFVSNGQSSPAATVAISSVVVYPAPSQLPA
jgi:hypothetical protein